MKELPLGDLKNIAGGKKIIFNITEDYLGNCTISGRFYEDNIYWIFIQGNFASIADAQRAIREMMNNTNREYEGADVIVNIRSKF